MAKLGINTGSAPDAGDGDSLQQGAIKINSNFDEVYTLLGDGSALAPGIVTSIVGGNNVEVSSSTGQVTIDVSGSTWGENSTGIHTLSNVGIGTTNATDELKVSGTVKTDQLFVVGVSTFSNDVNFEYDLVIGEDAALERNLKVTGVSTFVGESNFDDSVLIAGITTCSNDLDVSNDVVVGGGVSVAGVSTFAGYTTFENHLSLGDNDEIRLGSGDLMKMYYSSAGDVGAFVQSLNNDLHLVGSTSGGVRIITYNQDSLVANRLGSVDLYYNGSKKFETTNTGVTVTGALNATSFVGDGSGLTGINATGTGVSVSDGGSFVGVASAINFGNNLSVSPISAGIVTITGQAGGGSTADVRTNTLAVSGISTTGIIHVGHDPDTQGSGSIIKANEINLTGPNSTDSNSTFYSNIRLNRIGGGFRYDLEFHSNGYSSGDIGDFIFYRRGTSAQRFERMRLNGQTGDLSVTGGFAGDNITLNAGASARIVFGTGSGTNYAIKIGDESGGSSSDFRNTFVGFRAGYLAGNSNHDNNVFLGHYAGNDLPTSYGNVIIGKFDGIGSGLDLRYNASSSNGYIVLANGLGDVRYICDDNGNTGIGTTAITDPLTVAGSIKSQGDVKVTDSIFSLYSGSTEYAVSVGTKLSTHRYNGQGSSSSYYIDGVQAPFLTLTPGKTYRFTHDNTGSHPLKFYLEADRTTEYTTGVTFDDAYTEITVSDTTPQVLHYQCTNHAYMGNAVYTNANKVQTPYSASVGAGSSVNGVDSPALTLSHNNPIITGTAGTTGEIKQIGGTPFYYDGSSWREFVLSSGTPVTVPADTEWDNVIYRNTFDSNFVDAKFNVNGTVGGGITVTGSPVKIGGGALRIDGSQYCGVTYENRSEYSFTGSWTIEFWIYLDGATTANRYYSLVSMLGNGPTEWTFGYRTTSTNALFFMFSNEVSASGVDLGSVNNTDRAANWEYQWNHIALVREGGTGRFHFYINGVERSQTVDNIIIDNNIENNENNKLTIGADPANSYSLINSAYWNNGYSADVYLDDLRVSAGVGTAGQRYTSIGSTDTQTFTPSTVALPTTGTLSSTTNPPGDKYGEIVLGGTPSWVGTSGVTVSQQSSGNYRLTFTTSYTDEDDYFVLSQAMDQGFASYVGVARSTDHVDFSVNRQSNDAAVDTGSLSVQIKNHI